LFGKACPETLVAGQIRIYALEKNMNMKHRFLFFAVSCLLLFTGLNAAAQEKTAPLSPPGQDGSGPLPDPDGQTRAPAQTPAQSGGGPARGTGSSGPAQSSGTGTGGTGGSGSQSSGSQARSSAPAASRPAAQPAAAAAATASPIPEKGMFWGAMFGGSGYFLNDVSAEYGYGFWKLKGEGGFNIGLLFGYDYGLLALQTELLFVGENARYEYWTSGYGTHYALECSGTTMQIPVLLKLDLHWRRLMFQPLAGFYLNIPLGGMDYEIKEVYEGSGPGEGSYEYDRSPLFGLMFGGAFGVRIGRGYLFMDLRYATNMGETKLDDGRGTKWHRAAFMGNLGYQYYIKGKQ
jgi:hypothetical protein